MGSWGVKTGMSSKKRTGLFLLLCFSLSYGVAAIFFLLGGRLYDPTTVSFLILYMFLPTGAVFIVLKYQKMSLTRILGEPFHFNRWCVFAWLLPLFLVFAGLGLSLLVPGVEYSPTMEGLFERYALVMPEEQMQEIKSYFEVVPLPPLLYGVVWGLASGLLVNSIFALGEEIGWRGLLYNEFESLGFWPSSLAIGLIWGVWHAPIILQGYNYPQHPFEGVFMMILLAVLLSPVLNFVRLKSKSVFGAAIFHGTLNGVGGISIYFLTGGSDLVTGLTGVIGLVLLAFLNVVLYVVLKPHLAAVGEIS